MADLPLIEPSLADLRREIDRIDAEMHALLMERGTIIDRLIAVKKTQDSGSAFRPGREAAMMRVLAERHHGLLPFDTVESIWRVIISTFTYVQAPYTVHADVSVGDAPMRDSARFHFGFTVPYVTHQDAASVIAAVAQAAGDLGIFALAPIQAPNAWWQGLIGAQSPKIIARLPFVERSNHPASTPVFVISKPLADAAVRERIVYAAHAKGWTDTLVPKLEAAAISVEGFAADGQDQTALLMSAPEALNPAALLALFASLGVALSDTTEVGSHAARFHLA